MSSKISQTAIDQYVDRIMSQPVFPKDFDIRNCDVRVLLSKVEGPNSTIGRQQRTGQKNRDDLCTYLWSCLEHVKANPSNPANIEALKSLYAFPPETANEVMNSDCLILGADQEFNTSDAKVTKLAEELCSIAHGQREAYATQEPEDGPADDDLHSVPVGDRMSKQVYLVGRRGSGKTIFLNYLLSTKNHVFERNSVIWFRLDLASRKHEILPWFYWRMSKIVLDYYNGREIGGHNGHKPVKIDLSSENTDLKKRIVSEDPELERDRKFRLWFNISRGWLDMSTEPCPLPSHIPTLSLLPFYRGVWKHLILDLKLGFVCVIDGLDRLGLTPSEKAHYDTVVRDVKHGLLTNTGPSAAYIIAIRNESYTQVTQGERGSAYFGRLAEVDTWHVMAKRSEYAKRGNALQLTRFKEKHGSHFSISDDKHCEFAEKVFNYFLNFISHAVLSATGSETLETDQDDDFLGLRKAGLAKLDELFNQDKRHMFLSLQRALRYYFDTVLGGAIPEIRESERWEAVFDNLWSGHQRAAWKKSYLLVEGWMLDGYAFHLPKYKYLDSQVDSCYGEEFPARDKKKEHEFLPNVYHHVISDSTDQLALLSGLRILQYVRKQDGVPAEKIVDFLSTYFRYERGLLAARVEEFVSSEACLGYRSNPVYESKKLYLNSRGRLLLSSIAMQPEYINMAIQAAGLPYDLIENRTFRIVNAYKRKLFAAAKVVNYVNFFRLLQDLEAREEEIFNQIAERKYGDNSYRAFGDGAFLLASRYRDAFVSSTRKILQRAVGSRRGPQILKETQDQFGPIVPDS